MEINTLISFFGWCSIINITILTISTLSIVIFKDCITNLHAKLFKISDDNLMEIYFRYLGNYKVITLIFNVTPYFALNLIS